VSINPVNNADLIVQSLKEAGITHGFGIPSGNVLPMIDAMRRGGMEFVLTAHEGSASFAADVMGRLTGNPGFCIATLGPGATNLATGVGSAFLDRSPMIAITCNLNTPQLGRRIQMWIDHHALFRPITKATLAARHDNVAEVMREAISIALAEPQGPVHIDLPEDVSLAEAKGVAPAGVNPATRLPNAQEEALANASKIISKAKRPIAVIGSSAMRMQSPEKLKAFLEKHRIPFATTTMAKGLVDDDHPLAIGCIERGRRQVQRSFIRSCDLILGLGYDTIEVEYEAWSSDVPVLSLDIEPPDVAESVNLQGAVSGDLDDMLERLAGITTIPNSWNETEIKEHRENFQESLRPDTSTFTPWQAIDVVREVTPKEGILSFDVGAHTHQIASQWSAHAPRKFLITNGWSSMGFGLPGAIAAKISNPDKPVVCMLGDGCFQMTAGELATLRRMKLAVPVVVLDDRWLSLIQIKQHKRQYEQYGSNVEPEPYREPPSHYFNVPTVGVRSPDDLRKALEAAFKADGPTVIEAVVDGSHYFETVFD
jgi:acetolactate synthase-1/2/3 large subunit